MDLSLYFAPVDLNALGIDESKSDNGLLASSILMYNLEAPLNIADAQIAILGVPESRYSYENPSCAMAPDEIRRQLYRLYKWHKNVRIIDLGNLKVGKTVEDTYEVLSDILAFIIENKVIPIVLGGGNDLAFANYRAYEKMEQVVNLVAVDSRFDLGDEHQPIRSDAYLNKMVLQQPNFLLNYANVGFQTYMNSPATIKLMEDLFFETYRVGSMRKDIEEVEPIVRNADMVSLDISAVRRPDAPGCPHSSSNGFYGEEICQIAKYAGLSDKLSSFGIYEYDPTLDYCNQTSQLIAHIVWYFVEGYLNRPNDNQFNHKQDYRQYSIAVSGALSELVFFCSKNTGRWWMLVPMINKEKDTTQNYYLPCSKRDYLLACDDQIPDRWWKAYNKFNH
ncbi:MAG: formimidoylglutamase [Bacteroidales bacterium]|nr:formimidoylglutamase [Bacteroidales bacterium]